MIECRDCHEEYERAAYEWHATHPACCVESTSGEYAETCRASVMFLLQQALAASPGNKNHSHEPHIDNGDCSLTLTEKK